MTAFELTARLLVFRTATRGSSPPLDSDSQRLIVCGMVLGDSASAAAWVGSIVAAVALIGSAVGFLLKRHSDKKKEAKEAAERKDREAKEARERANQFVVGFGDAMAFGVGQDHDEVQFWAFCSDDGLVIRDVHSRLSRKTDPTLEVSFRTLPTVTKVKASTTTRVPRTNGPFKKDDWELEVDFLDPRNNRWCRRGNNLELIEASDGSGGGGERT